MTCLQTASVCPSTRHLGDPKKKLQILATQVNDKMRSQTLTLALTILAIVAKSNVQSFTHPPSFLTETLRAVKTSKQRELLAGGFEYEDPKAFDQGVDNPYKISEGTEVDPSVAARLLGPRLGGSTVYLIGMMGSGKSAVGDIVARREFIENIF